MTLEVIGSMNWDGFKGFELDLGLA